MAFMCPVQGRRDFYFQDFKLKLNRVWHTTNSPQPHIAQHYGRGGEVKDKRKG